MVSWNGTCYAYVKNLQGDIVGIVDANDNEVVRYFYDAWGKPTGKSGTMAGTLGTVQPFRYRGYVFDEETQYYYLRSRFFHANAGRFVNADKIIQGNLFCYCQNRPISYFDNNGTAGQCAYNPQSAVEYAAKYYNSKDDMYQYRSANNNCARFVSQCLYAGMDMPDEFYSDWHCFKRGSDQLDQTKSWRLTNPLYRFLTGSGLVFDTIRINSDTNIEQLL